MDIRKICKILLVFLIVLSIGTTSEATSWDSWIKGIQIIPIDSNTSPNANFEVHSESKPVTWADLLRVLEKDFPDHDLNKLLKVTNKNKLPLIVTKNEVANVSKVLIELSNQSFLNRLGINHLNRTVGAVNPSRNYFVIKELDEIMTLIKTSTVRNGLLGQTLQGKLSDINYETRVGEFEIIIDNKVQQVKYPLNLVTPWEIKNTMYEIILENGVVLELQPKTEFSYGFVKNGKEGLEVNGDDIKLRPDNMAKAGDYIEYIIENEQVVITKNFKAPTSDIVKEVQTDKLNTVNGKNYNSTYNFLTLEGIPLSLKDIKKNDVIFKFEDNTILVTSNSREEEFSLIGKTLVISGAMYDSKSVLITDGDFIISLNDWEYNKEITKGEIIRDLFKTPMMIKIPKVNYNVFVVEETKGEVTLISNSDTTKIEKDNDFKRLDKNEFYKLVVIEDKIIKSEKLRIKPIKVDKLYMNTITFDKERFVVDKDTRVILSENGKLNTITYDKLVESYRDTIKSGYMEIKAVTNGKNVDMMYVDMIVKQGFNENIDFPKADFYKVESIEYEQGTTIITLVVDGKTSKFTYDRFLSKSYVGADVEVEFDNNGVIKSIK